MLRIVVQNGAVCGCFNSQQILLKELLLRGDLNFFVLSAIPNLKRDESYKYNTHKIDRHRMLQSITGSKCDSRTKSKQSEKKKKSWVHAFCLESLEQGYVACRKVKLKAHLSLYACTVTKAIRLVRQGLGKY